MSIFQTLKQDAVNFLEPYKTKEPATYAAAEQAIGAILITDGLVGLDNPFGQKKAPRNIWILSRNYFWRGLYIYPNYFR